MKTIKTLRLSVKALPSFFAILLMCFSGFAFADGHLAGEEGHQADTEADSGDTAIAQPTEAQPTEAVIRTSMEGVTGEGGGEKADEGEGEDG